MKLSSLRAMLQISQECFGTWSQIGSAELIDILGSSGYEFTIIDAEHGTLGIESVENLVRACSANNILPLVRVPSLDRVWIGKALDVGASGVVIPGIETVEQAAAAIAATRFAPLGTRGACPCVRAGGQYVRDWPGYAAQESEIGAVLLVETPAAVENIEAICALPDLMGILIGPFDLSVAMGLNGNYQHSEVKAAVNIMLEAAHKRAIPVIYPVFNPNSNEARGQMAQLRAAGIRHFVIGTDKILIAEQFKCYREAMSAQ
jgi:4-hydroxy-2-oxoheptanedioate aldolase